MFANGEPSLRKLVTFMIAGFCSPIALPIARTAAADVFLPCRKRQLRPTISSLA